MRAYCSKQEHIQNILRHRQSAVILFLLLGIEQVSAGILVLVPHPDDDIITAAGIILNAASQGRSVKVIFITNGDRSGTDSGYARQGEAVTAQSNLGTVEDDLIFLGYPDYHLQEVFQSYPNSNDSYTTPLGQSLTYGNRGLGRRDYHTYRFGIPALYNRANIVFDLQDIISTYNPDHIYTVAEYDQHLDHSTTYQLLKLALDAVHTTNPSYAPVVHKTIVWSVDNTAWPTALDPTTYHTEVPGLSTTTLVWTERESLDVPAPMQSTNFAANPKYQAVQAHASQDGVSGFIGKFIHKDEIFWAENPFGTNRPPVVNAGTGIAVGSGATAQLNGTGSFDPEGLLLTYQWTQMAGPLVALANASTATPSFTAPIVSATTVLSFQLVVSDGSFTSAPDLVNVTVQAAQTGSNIAGLATVTASSQNTSTGQLAIKAVDGVADGYPGDYTREWATTGQKTGAWLKLTWSNAYTIDRVVLYDRPNTNDQITSATLSFSDGSSVTVGSLTNNGAGVTVNFTPRTVTSVTLTVNGVASTTSNIGMAEIEVYGVPGG